VWCAGAGGLAEPLTVLLRADAAGVDVDLIATDADADIRTGIVPGRRLALPRSVTTRRLVGDVAGHRPVAALAARLRSAVGDVREVPAGGPFDLVVCRDVLHHLRPDVVRVVWSRLLQSVDEGGVLVVGAVDALAASQPLSGGDDVVFGPDGAVAFGIGGDALVDDGDAAPLLRLAALLDEGAPLARRAARMWRLSREQPDLEEARVAAGALALADGQRDLARQLLEAPLSLAWEGDACTILAVAALHEGRLHQARTLLGRAPPTSWLAAFLLGSLLRRVQREGDAAAHFRRALALLDGHDNAPAGAAFLAGCAPAEALRIGQAALRSRAHAWHGP
jgi:SAM-dependent methyltransferase